MDPMLLIKPWPKNQSKTASKYSQNNNIINMFIKGFKNVLKMENNEENSNYIKINQEMKSKTIEKSEKRPSNFTKILGIF